MGSAGSRLPWRALLGWAVLGATLGALLVLIDVHNTGSVAGGLIHTGPTGPASRLLAQDFPSDPQYTNGEHDGPMFYAFARDFWDLDTVAQSLDRPRYRLQRPVYPFLAWTLDPTGSGGDPLVRALFVVNLLAAFGGALALGALSRTLRGPVWLGVLYPLLPGVLTGWRVSVADTLAVALMLGATITLVRGRWVWAAALAVLAVLTKEPVFVTFVGLALWRRDRRAIALVAAPVVVAGAWQLYLRNRFPDSGQDVIEFGPPLRGIGDSWRLLWHSGGQTLALVAFLAALVLAVAALVRRRPAHPMWWPTLVNLLALAPLTVTVIGLDRNGPRAVMPLCVLALVGVAAPGLPASSPATADDPSPVAAT